MRKINGYRGMQELNLSLTLAIGIEKIMTYCTKLVSIFLQTLGLTRDWLVTRG